MAENKPDDLTNPIADRAVASVADAVRIATEASLASPGAKPVRRPAARAAATPATPVVTEPRSTPEAETAFAAEAETPPPPVVTPVVTPVVALAPFVPTPAASVPPSPDVPTPTTAPVATTFTRKMETMMTTAEELMSFQQGNIEAMIRSSQIWVTGLQDLGRTLAASAQAHMDETFGTVKAITSAKSLREAVELQSTLARTSVEKAVSEGGKLTDASLKLAEQTWAPITARLTLAAERFGRTAA